MATSINDKLVALGYPASEIRQLEDVCCHAVAEGLITMQRITEGLPSHLQTIGLLVSYNLMMKHLDQVGAEALAMVMGEVAKMKEL